MGIPKGTQGDDGSSAGPATFDDPDLMIQAVLGGTGIGMALEESVKEMTAKGQLVEVLKDWCPTFPGYFLYYPSRHNQAAALTALINTLRLSK